jgi:hypothetical protein
LRPERPFVPERFRWHYAAMALVVAALGGIMLFGHQVSEELVAPYAAIMSLDPDRQSQQALRQEIRNIVQGYPIENMSASIARQDRTVAAYLVSIAKKESNWGKRVPRYRGQDCYNYWGYRGPSEKTGTGGHTCFDSPQEAVETVGNRIHELVYEQRRDTPAEMIVWKCGYSCDGHSAESVRKWKQDVGYYFRKFTSSKE